MILCEWDGVLVVPYTATLRAEALSRLQGRELVIATNQSGPVWRRLTSATKYPTAAELAQKFFLALYPLLQATPRVHGLYIATHPGERARGFKTAQSAADDVASHLTHMLSVLTIPIVVSGSYHWRWPALGMLQRILASGGTISYSVMATDETCQQLQESGLRCYTPATWPVTPVAPLDVPDDDDDAS